MAETRTEVIDGQEITIVEDSRKVGEDGKISDFLAQAQDIEEMSQKDKEEELARVFHTDQPKAEDEKEPEITPAQKEENDKRKAQIDERDLNSRANSDVALAMMLADQAVADSGNQTCYVVHGAKMICSMGSREARLVVPLDHGVCLTKSPLMLDEDSKGLENIKCFGQCFSVENPNMKQEAVDTTNRYNQAKSQTLWGKIKSFFGVKPKEVEHVTDELTIQCICECIPEFVKTWSDGHEKSLVDEKKTLIQTCTITCLYGGIIKIVDNGQGQ